MQRKTFEEQNEIFKKIKYNFALFKGWFIMILPWLLQWHDLRWELWQNILLQGIFESWNDAFNYVECVVLQDEVKRISPVESGILPEVHIC